jgi:UDP-N-acetylglucosamine 2-epimerase (non-hydrolysing)
MRKDQSLFDITARGLRDLEDVLKKTRPDIVLVQGDTTTAFVASLAAFYLRIKIGHVEAGLRTEDKYNPFPEEMNRRLVDALGDFYFAPTPRAEQNLLHEGIPVERVFVTGNTVIDALLWMVGKQATATYQKEMGNLFHKKYGVAVNEKRLILVTGHRRESFGEGFENICQGLKLAAEHNPDIQIVYPVHMNPNVREPVYRILSGGENVRLIEPLNYAHFVFLMNRAYLILTDSGGIQEEAPSLGKPVLVMRNTTERPEAVEAGTVILTGTDTKKIVKEADCLLDSKIAYDKNQQPVIAPSLWGDGALTVVFGNVRHSACCYLFFD